MARARQGHGPRQACPSGDTETGADAHAREWLCLSRFAEGQWSVAARGDLTEAKDFPRIAPIERKGRPRPTALPQHAENTLDGRPRP